MEETVDERRPPVVPHHLRTEHDVAELAGQLFWKRVAPVEREGKNVGRLIDPEVPRFQRPHLVGSRERDAKIPVLNSFGGEDAPAEGGCGALVHRDAASILELDTDHLRRCVPVSSAWRLYASTIRWTSMWRTTSWLPNSTNWIPSIAARISRT